MYFNRPTISLVVRAAMLIATSTFATSIAAADGRASLSALRAAQAQRLQALDRLYSDLARRAGSDAAMLKDSYVQERNQIRKGFLEQDTRWSDFQRLKAQLGSGIDNTGSPPADVRADMDIRANSNEAAHKVVEAWKAKGHIVEELPGGMGYVDKTADMTLWNPCDTPQCLKAKIEYYDSFGTEGGRHAAGNRDAVADPYGFGLDNEKKFLHGLAEGDVKTVAKSVSKAGEAAGTSDGSSFWKQAKDLQKYGDPKTAGIADLNDSPAVAQQKMADWLKVAKAQMTDALAELKRVGEFRDWGWRRGAENLKNSTAADEWVRKWDLQDAEEILAQRNRVLQSNVAAEQGNAEAQSQDAKERGAGGRRPVTAKGLASAGLSGAAQAAIATFALCLSNLGLEHVKECADQARGSMPLGAFLGMAAAASPFLEGVLIGYGAGQGIINIAEATHEGVGALAAAIDMRDAEAMQQQQAQANWANTDAFRRRIQAMEKRIRGIEFQSSLFAEACEKAQTRGSPGAWIQVAGKLRKSLPADKNSLNIEITAFGYAYPQNALMTSLTDAWRGRVSQAASIVERMVSCTPL